MLQINVFGTLNLFFIWEYNLPTTAMAGFLPYLPGELMKIAAILILASMLPVIPGSHPQLKNLILLASITAF